MNRYPRWKYALILVALLTGLLYSLPNLFGEIPAVQISPIGYSATLAPGLIQRVEKILTNQNIPYQGAMADTNGVKIQLADTDTQLKARDAIQSELSSGYSVALNLLSATPVWLQSLGALPMYLGLDLRGGVYFLMQIDMNTVFDKRLDRMSSDVRTTLHDKHIAFADVNRDGQTVVVHFKDPQAVPGARTELRQNMQNVDFTASDSTTLVLSLNADGLRNYSNQAIEQNIITLRNRINELGVAEPIVQQQGPNRIVVQLPGVQDTARAKDILGRTASLEIRMVDDASMDSNTMAQAARGTVPLGDEYFPTSRDGEPLLVRKSISLTGENITSASSSFDQTGKPAVFIRLDSGGSHIFSRLTRENVGKRLAIILVEKNHGDVITAPVIREEISGGQVQITGHMTIDVANDIALLLRAGALAAPMEIIEERTIGPSLGADNIRMGVRSVVGGFLAVALFMAVYYRLMGVFSTVALGANVLLLVAILSLMQATLTLPGLAAIALTVGMAIDANVLINERIREELRNGQTPHAAINAGYQRAFSTIVDSNVTNFIAGAALFACGSGPVRGFAAVLCIGILTSIFSAVVVSRALVNLTYGRKRRLEHVSV